MEPRDTGCRSSTSTRRRSRVHVLLETGEHYCCFTSKGEGFTYSDPAPDVRFLSPALASRQGITSYVTRKMQVMSRIGVSVPFRLLEVLVEAGHPLTITEIIDSDRSLATSSAYRNLVVLEQAGLVHRVITGEDFARYELAEELTEHHHHLVCSSCGLVRDLPSDRNMERLMRAVIAKVAEQGFTPMNHRLDIVGLCSDCSRVAASSGSARG